MRFHFLNRNKQVRSQALCDVTKRPPQHIFLEKLPRHILELQSYFFDPIFNCADLDPSRVCKGKGVVTLRATLVHIDDEDCVSVGPDVADTPSKCERAAALAL